MDHRLLSRSEVNDLVDLYWYQEGYQFPGDFEHRLDKNSSKVLYSLLRKYKPKVCLEFGTSWGGTACVAISAIQKDRKRFKYLAFEKEEGLRNAAKENILKKCGINLEIYGDIMLCIDKMPQALDFVFIDPDWERDIAEWTFENIIPRVKTDGLVCIHDWSVNKELQYQGGGFPGIFYFIELFKEKKMPLEKLFSMWDQPDYKESNHALSFWRKV